MDEVGLREPEGGSEESGYDFGIHEPLGKERYGRKPCSAPQEDWG